MKVDSILVLAGCLLSGSALMAQPSIQTLFGGPPDGLPGLSSTMNSPDAVLADSRGGVIVGLRGGHQIVRIGTDGVVSSIAGTGISGNSGDGGPAKQAAVGQPSGFAFDQAGNLYFADATNNNIRRIATDGTISTIAGTGKSAYSGDGGPALKAALWQPTQIVFDANGNLLIADTGNHSIRMIAPDGTISRYAGAGTQSAGGDGGLATLSGLYFPYGIALDSQGNVYISDTGNQKIRIVTPDGMINLYAGRGLVGYFGDNGDPLKAVFYNPTTLAMDRADQLYINDQSNARIRRIQNDGRIVSVAGTGVKGAEGDGGLAKSANISPVAIALDTQNNLLIADGDNNRVRRVTTADGVIDTIAGNGISSYDPRYLFRKGDSLYFSDGNAQRIRLFNLATGAISVVAGSGNIGFSGDGDTVFNAYLKNPRGLTVDSAGNLYFADSGNHRIRKVDTSSNISTIAGTGTATSTGDGGAATSATLNEPVDVAFDSSGNLYVAERSGQRVRKIAKDQIITTVAGTGSGGSPDSESGVAVSQQLSLPQGLFVEKDGSVLIADTGNNRVRRLKADGTITTIAGVGNASYDGDGGPATSASLNGPVGLTEDDAGNIYINDSNSSAIRQIGADGIITTVAGVSTPTGPSRTGGFNGDGSPATSYLLNRPMGLAASATSCSVLLADTNNQRLRQVSAGVTFAVVTDPPGQQITVDGQSAVATPASVIFVPGTLHTIGAPAIQDNGSGTRYLSTSSVSASSTCGAPRQNVTVKLKTQYSLTLTPDPGGSILLPDTTAPNPWQDTGTQVILVPTPSDGFVFTGWDGDCTGAEACQVMLDQPKNVVAHFVAKP